MNAARPQIRRTSQSAVQHTALPCSSRHVGGSLHSGVAPQNCVATPYTNVPVQPADRHPRHGGTNACDTRPAMGVSTRPLHHVTSHPSHHSPKPQCASGAVGPPARPGSDAKGAMRFATCAAARGRTWVAGLVRASADVRHERVLRCIGEHVAVLRAQRREVERVRLGRVWGYVREGTLRRGHGPALGRRDAVPSHHCHHAHKCDTDGGNGERRVAAGSRGFDSHHQRVSVGTADALCAHPPALPKSQQPARKPQKDTAVHVVFWRDDSPW